MCHDGFNPFRSYCVVAEPVGGRLPLKGNSGGPLVCRLRRKDKGEEVVAGTVMYGDNGVYIIYKKWIMKVRRKVMAKKREIKETSRKLREMQWKEIRRRRREYQARKKKITGIKRSLK